jgi:hypothetical protein
MFTTIGQLPSGRKVIRRRKKERKKEREKKKKMNSVATTFATQPVCNTARTAHALHSDQLTTFETEVIQL